MDSRDSVILVLTVSPRGVKTPKSS